MLCQISASPRKKNINSLRTEQNGSGQSILEKDFLGNEHLKSAVVSSEIEKRDVLRWKANVNPLSGFHADLWKLSVQPINTYA